MSEIGSTSDSPSGARKSACPQGASLFFLASCDTLFDFVYLDRAIETSPVFIPRMIPARRFNRSNDPRGRRAPRLHDPPHRFEVSHDRAVLLPRMLYHMAR
jgi:hypothetical protein